MAKHAVQGDLAGRAPSFGTGPELARFLVLAAFLLLALVGGGASRHDVVSLIYLRPAAVLCIAALLIIPGPYEWRPFRFLYLLFGAWALVIALQLVPLPPDLWLALPGREAYAEAAAAAGLEQPWRPLTLTPDLTVNALLALLPPLAVLVGLSSLRLEQRHALLPLLLGAACLSAILGVAQLTSDARGPAYLYSITHEGSAVGVFANRNHQAALLAMAFPMLRVWTLLPARHAQHRQTRFWIAVAVGLFLIPMILVTGSRAGLAMAGVGMIAAFLVEPRFTAFKSRPGKWKIAAILGAALLPLILLGVAVMMGRAVALQRLFSAELAEANVRLAFSPIVLEIVRDFFPWGSGFGSFDAIFRQYEPDAILVPEYYNRAHNDLFETALSGGLPALLVLVLFLVWWAVRTFKAYRPGRPAQSHHFARLGAIMILIALLASIVDYPLRTPLFASIFVIACGWLASGRGTGLARRDKIEEVQ